MFVSFSRVPLPTLTRQPRNAVAVYRIASDRRAQYVVPLPGESSFRAIRRVAREVGFNPIDAVALRNLV